MRPTYRPIAADWRGERTPPNERRRAPFYRQGSLEPGTGQWRAGSKVSWTDTLVLLDRELSQLGAEAVVFQLDLREADIRLDGLPRSDARLADPAVIVSFESEYGPLRYQCDTFTDWQDNVRAIALGLEALRKVDRYGISRRGEQYAGWTALGEGGGVAEGVVYHFANPEEAARHLAKLAGAEGDEVLRQAGIALVDKAYRDSLFRRAALKVHPDQGGSRVDWDTLEEARRVVESAA